MPAHLFAWLQSTSVATTIANSLVLTGGLSAIHLVGFAVLLGSALVSSLRLTGAIFADRRAVDVTGSTDRGIGAGLSISVATGLLLFSSRASSAAENGAFQLKMCALLVAVAFHFLVHRRVVRRPSASRGQLLATGAAGLALWAGVAVAGCAFIFLE